MLTEDNARMRKAGCELAEAALRVIREYDGVHRLSIAAAAWCQAVADEGRRAPPAPADLSTALERERCAKIADAEAAEAYRNPRAASYRSPEMEKMARYTAERIAKLIRNPHPTQGEQR